MCSVISANISASRQPVSSSCSRFSSRVLELQPHSHLSYTSSSPEKISGYHFAICPVVYWISSSSSFSSFWGCRTSLNSSRALTLLLLFSVLAYVLAVFLLFVLLRFFCRIVGVFLSHHRYLNVDFLSTLNPSL